MLLHLVIAALSLAYPLVRYVALGTTPASSIPLFVVNKAVCIYAIAALFLHVHHRLRGNKAQAAHWFAAMAVASIGHVAMTLCMLSPVYYAKLYDAGRLTWSGELAMLAGVVASGLWFSGRVRRWLDPWLALRLGAVCVAIHLAAIGLPGWFKPETWPGKLPPITLLCFLATVTVVLHWRRREP